MKKLILLLFFICAFAYSHRDMKNIAEGVVYPQGYEKETLTIKELIQLGKEKGYYVKSPARTYLIRDEDTESLTNYLKQTQSNKVKIQLVIDVRTESKELWKVMRVRQR